jgi:hypothetical protein
MVRGVSLSASMADRIWHSGRAPHMEARRCGQRTLRPLIWFDARQIGMDVRGQPCSLDSMHGLLECFRGAIRPAAVLWSAGDRDVRTANEG